MPTTVTTRIINTTGSRILVSNPIKTVVTGRR